MPISRLQEKFQQVAFYSLAGNKIHCEEGVSEVICKTRDIITEGNKWNEVIVNEKEKIIGKSGNDRSFFY